MLIQFRNHQKPASLPFRYLHVCDDSFREIREPRMNFMCLLDNCFDISAKRAIDLYSSILKVSCICIESYLPEFLYICFVGKRTLQNDVQCTFTNFLEQFKFCLFFCILVEVLLQILDKPKLINKYSRTSMARTLMARLPRLFRTRS